MGEAGAALEVAEAEVFYGALKVLDGISLAVAAGEFIALLGSSGCGKTRSCAPSAASSRSRAAASPSPAATSPTCRPTSATWRWSSSPTPSGRI
jgi:hypothetical protein